MIVSILASSRAVMYVNMSLQQWGGFARFFCNDLKGNASAYKVLFMTTRSLYLMTIEIYIT